MKLQGSNFTLTFVFTSKARAESHRFLKRYALQSEADFLCSLALMQTEYIKTADMTVISSSTNRLRKEIQKVIFIKTAPKLL